MKLDDQRTMQLLSPRKTEHWSQTDKDRVAKLTESSRMHEAELRVVAALEKHPPALEHYEAFPDSAKRDILRWMKLANKPETRAKRLQKTAALAAENKRASGAK
jgi:uncharacterized protein YdeI (YjbR/CyaY-like superfamily)